MIRILGKIFKEIEEFRFGVVFFPVCEAGNINIGHNVNFTVKPIIIKTVHAFLIMLQHHDPESGLHLLTACNCE